MKRTVITLMSLAVIMLLTETPAMALDKVDRLNPTATGWMGPTIAILVIAGFFSISLKPSKRTHQD